MSDPFKDAVKETIRKQRAAIQLGIEALQMAKRRHAVDANIYLTGQAEPDQAPPKSGIQYTGMDWALKAHQRYQEYEEAIIVLQDWLEILDDPGATIDDTGEIDDAEEKETDPMAKLTETLNSQIDEAKRSGKIAVRKLARGLRIAIAIKGQSLTLVLSRTNDYPHINEWYTILRNLPFTARKVQPTRESSNDRFHLKGEIQIPDQNPQDQLALFPSE